MTKTFCLMITIGSLLLLGACGTNTKENKEAKQTTEENKPKERLSFDEVIGIRYTEVKRRFSNGLSFNELGFQQEPSWIIEFQSNDTVLAYSPVKKKMLPFFLMYDHGDVYNFAKEYFRIKKVTKDSLVFQRLHVFKKQISSDIMSDVNMTFYANAYIQNVLKTTAEQLQRPTKADTLYIKKLVDKSNRNPANPKTAFAGRIPVQFSSKSPILKVKKRSTVDPLSGRTQAFDYLFPNYRIDISKAYKDFGYAFKVVVDANGKIHLSSPGNTGMTAPKARIKTLNAIISVYLQNLMEITPGTTLGIPHPSEIDLVVVGKTAD